jgi:outer membrane receptor for ferrienterochelin and colicin
LNAQSDSTEIDFYALSLVDLLNIEISVASTTKLTQRESPGIVTVISSDEIESSGARDLIDVLRTVPGLSFGHDVEGVIGLSSRGNWGHEGKILLLVDGQEQNEILYSTTQFGNHYDVNQIQRIEIIRGPGSAIYGGNAELGVINIITKSGSDIDGVTGSISYGQTEGQLGRANLSVGIGKEIKGWNFSAQTFLGKANRSNSPFTDIYGDQVSGTNGSSEIDITNLNVGLSKNGFSSRFIFDEYKFNTPILYEFAETVPVDVKFKNLSAELKYKFQINDNLTITPKLNYINQIPWGTIEKDNKYIVNASKIIGNILASYNISENINIIAGIEYFDERADNKVILVDDPWFLNGKDKIGFNTFSGFTQALVKSKYVNFTAGARYMNHNQYGSAIAPRVGLTKVYRQIHAKALISGAFRAPAIENINLNDDIKPENTIVAELELGYQITSKMFVNANVYDILIKSPIVYYYDEVNDLELYDNFKQAGSRGIEVEYKYKDNWGFINFNISHYSTAGKNEVDFYTVAGDENSVVGIPRTKTNLMASIKITDKISIKPTVTYLSEKYQFATVDLDDTSVLSETEQVVLANLYISYKNIIPGLSFGVGAYDLLDAKLTYTQPFNGYAAPLPGYAPEILFKIKYRI